MLHTSVVWVAHDICIQWSAHFLGAVFHRRYLQVVYQFGTLFSATSLYDSWLLMSWNMVVTAIPIMLYGMFEVDLVPQELLRHPSVYRSMLRNAQLSYGRLCMWLLLGLLHSCIVDFGARFAFNGGLGRLLSGVTVYTALLLVVTLRIIVDTAQWTRVTVLGMVLLSVVPYFAFIFLYTGVDDIFGSATTPGVYWSIILLSFFDVGVFCSFNPRCLVNCHLCMSVFF